MATLGVTAPALGERPWLEPGPDDVELNAFNGRPSAGLIATDFGALLFWQFSGHGSGIGMWLYLPLSDEEAEYIVGHPGEPLLEGIRDRLAGRQGVLALSQNGQVRAKGPYTFEKITRYSSPVTRMLRALAAGLENAQPELPSGRKVEIADNSENFKRDAVDQVEAALAGCSS